MKTEGKLIRKYMNKYVDEPLLLRIKMNLWE